MRRVAITGLGAVTPCGNDVPTTWGAMLEGRSGVVRVTRFDVAGQDCVVAGEVKGFDGAAILGPREIRRLGLFQQYALVASDEAMADAGFRRGEIWPDPERLGVYVGSGIGGLPEITEFTRISDRDGMQGMSPFFIPKSLINLHTGQIAIRNNAQGPSLVVSTACAVGNHAIGEAWRIVGTGEADVMIAGGSEASLIPLGFGGFQAMKAMSKHKGDPAKASRPFDRLRDGFVMAEGSGIVVLEELEHAKARGARIYCEIVGYANTTDAHHITAPAPGHAGAARCMRRALEVGGLRPEDVDYINAHGTATPANDPAETTAIRTVFGSWADKLAVSSTKGVTGHMLGAAGGVEAVASALVLYNGIAPPTANLENPDPQCDLDFIPGKARPGDYRAVVSNGFGFGGTNGVLAFKRYEER